MKYTVDPKRFIGKPFTLRKTYSHSVNDYCMMIDGLTAGRVTKTTNAVECVVWEWSLDSPYFVTGNPTHGKEETFEAARDALRTMFWEWNAWALKHLGEVSWYSKELE